MAKIYFSLITSKVINPKTNRFYTIDDVPSRYKDAVIALLELSTGD